MPTLLEAQSSALGRFSLLILCRRRWCRFTVICVGYEQAYPGFIGHFSHVNKDGNFCSCISFQWYFWHCCKMKTIELRLKVQCHMVGFCWVAGLNGCGNELKWIAWAACLTVCINFFKRFDRCRTSNKRQIGGRWGARVQKARNGCTDHCHELAHSKISSRKFSFRIETTTRKTK